MGPGIGKSQKNTKYFFYHSKLIYEYFEVLLFGNW